MPPVALRPVHVLSDRSPLGPSLVGIDFLAYAPFSWVLHFPYAADDTGGKMYGFTKKGAELNRSVYSLLLSHPITFFLKEHFFKLVTER